MRILLLFIGIGFMLMTPGQAIAKQTDAAAAEVLFQKGRTALTAQDYETACQMFGESLALDPAVGTVMNLAACEEKRGALTASWERWHEALRLLEEGDPRVQFAMEQLNSVQAQLSYLTIVLVEGAPKSLKIERDGVVLGKPSIGQRLPANPGTHVVKVQSERYESRTYNISLEPGETRELAVSAGALKPQVKLADQSAGVKAQKIAGFSSLGVGAIGLGTLIVTGVLLPAQDRKVDEHCPGKVCDPTGEQAISGAKTLLAINTAAWVITGVGLATGAVLLVTLPRNKEQSSIQKHKIKGPAQPKATAQLDSRPEPRPTQLGLAIVGTGIQVFGEF